MVRCGLLDLSSVEDVKYVSSVGEIQNWAESLRHCDTGKVPYALVGCRALGRGGRAVHRALEPPDVRRQVMPPAPSQCTQRC